MTSTTLAALARRAAPLRTTLVLLAVALLASLLLGEPRTSIALGLALLGHAAFAVARVVEPEVRGPMRAMLVAFLVVAVAATAMLFSLGSTLETLALAFVALAIAAVPSALPLLSLRGVSGVALRFLLAGSVGQLLLTLTAVFFAAPLPATPLALLWISVLGHGLPGAVLVRGGVTSINQGDWRRIIALGALDAIAAASMFGLALALLSVSLPAARGLVVVVLMTSAAARVSLYRPAPHVSLLAIAFAIATVYVAPSLLDVAAPPAFVLPLALTLGVLPSALARIAWPFMEHTEVVRHERTAPADVAWVDLRTNDTPT